MHLLSKSRESQASFTKPAIRDKIALSFYSFSKKKFQKIGLLEQD